MSRPTEFGPQIARPFAILFLAAAAMAFTAGRSEALAVIEQGEFTINFNMRIQPRIELDRLLTGGGEWRRDFMVRRMRLTAFGKVDKVGYKMEWKVDAIDRQGGDRAPTIPSGAAENAYIQYPLGGTVELRAGLYDIPYSRDLLTSDSQQLAVDRGAVSNVPSAQGLVDNAVGLHVLGKAAGGHADYAVGLFDNRNIATRFQDIPMVVGRVDLNFASTKDVFTDAHFGADRWISLGVNGQFQGSLEDSAGNDQGENSMFGGDGIVDVPMGSNRVVARGEINRISTKPPTGGNSIETTVWMLGAGLLMFDQKVQPFVRFDETMRDQAAGGGKLDVTYAGVNWYQKKHNLKVQADVRFDSGSHESVDGARLQAQIYY